MKKRLGSLWLVAGGSFFTGFCLAIALALLINKLSSVDNSKTLGAEPYEISSHVVAQNQKGDKKTVGEQHIETIAASFHLPPIATPNNQESMHKEESAGLPTSSLHDLAMNTAGGTGLINHLIEIEGATQKVTPNPEFQALASHKLPPEFVATLSSIDHEIVDIVASYSSGEAKFSANLKTLIQEHPDYQLAQVLYADWILQKIGDAPPKQSRLEHIRSELFIRYKGILRRQEIQDKLPASLIYVDKSYPYALVFDASVQRLYLFKNTKNGLKLKKDLYATVGQNGFGKEKEGDKRTPVGSYILRGFISSDRIDHMIYGDQGAWVIDYPNALDKNKQRTGYGIWIHGTPIKTLIRAPYSSSGCISLSNEDFTWLKQSVGSHALKKQITPLLVVREVHWISRSANALLAENWVQYLNSWKKDWESQKIAPYISHYSKHLSIGGRSYDGFYRYKARVNSNKSYIKVNIDKLIVIASPENQSVRALFYQHYNSDKLESSSYKELFLAKEGERYLIQLEDEVAPPNLNPSLGSN